MSQLDHLIVANRDLTPAVDEVERLLGVSVAPGGRHEDKGTHNVLVGLGPGAYLEVVAADPERPDPDRPRWFGIDDIDEPRLVSWCVRPAALGDAVAAVSVAGLDLGPVSSGSRMTADGREVSWRVSDPFADRMGGVIPFLIDWGDTAHPSSSLDHPCRCEQVVLIHPDADTVRRVVDALGLDAEVRSGPSPRIEATVTTADGTVLLT